MIFTDVLIVILSLSVSDRYELVFRNAAFVAGTLGDGVRDPPAGGLQLPHPHFAASSKSGIVTTGRCLRRSFTPSRTER
jgi:hypothetical protein